MLFLELNTSALRAGCNCETEPAFPPLTEGYLYWSSSHNSSQFKQVSDLNCAERLSWRGWFLKLPLEVGCFSSSISGCTGWVRSKYLPYFGISSGPLSRIASKMKLVMSIGGDCSNGDSFFTTFNSLSSLTSFSLNNVCSLSLCLSISLSFSLHFSFSLAPLALSLELRTYSRDSRFIGGATNISSLLSLHWWSCERPLAALSVSMESRISSYGPRCIGGVTILFLRLSR